MFYDSQIWLKLVQVKEKFRFDNNKKDCRSEKFDFKFTKSQLSQKR